MMFASKITQDVQFGDDRVTVRKLSALTLGKARDARQAVQAKYLRNYGGDILKALKSDSAEALAEKMKEHKESADARRKARYDEFDREIVLNAGIVSWTDERPVSPEAISDLDEATASRLHEAIIDLSVTDAGGKD